LEIIADPKLISCNSVPTSKFMKNSVTKEKSITVNVNLIFQFNEIHIAVTRGPPDFLRL
jgi:hypothetical protein